MFLTVYLRVLVL